MFLYVLSVDECLITIFQCETHIYTDMSEQELDETVSRIQQEFPLCGYWQMQGHLTAQGIRVQQGRVRESQRWVDPGGCIMRRLSSINRRFYRVNGRLALWHIDGNHKY